jgi:hypothetical protein
MDDADRGGSVPPAGVAGVKRPREIPAGSKDGYPKEFRDLRAAINDAAKRVDIAGGLAVFEEMIKKFTPTVHIYNAVLSLCCRAAGGVDAGIAAKAKMVFERMRAEKAVEEAAYSSIVKICALAGDASAARAYFDDACRDKVPLKLRTYSPLLAAYASMQDDRSVEWLWMHMRNAAISPAQADYAVLIDALGRAGRDTDVAKVLSALAAHEFRADPPLVTAVQTYFSGRETSKGVEMASELGRSAVGRWQTAQVTIPRRGVTAGVCPLSGAMLQVC